MRAAAGDRSPRTSFSAPPQEFVVIASAALTLDRAADRSNECAKAATNVLMSPAPQLLTVEIIRTNEALLSLRAEWDALYGQTDPRNPFLSSAWTLACWSMQNDEAKPLVLAARERGALVGLAPLCIERRFGFRVLRFIAEDRSDYLGFLLLSGRPDVRTALLEAVTDSSQEWDLLVLRQLTDSYSDLHQAEIPRRLERHETMWTRAPFCRWSGDWDALHKDGPSWFREMRKRSRRFYRDGNSTHCFKGSEAIERLPIVAEIEAASWKGRQHTTRLQSGSGLELMRSAFSSLGAEEMELWIAFAGDQPAAFQIDFISGDRVWHYQCAYDESLRRSRAGSVLAYAALEHGWKEDKREFDYLSGEEPYKTERTNGTRTIHHVAAHRRTARGWAAYGLLLAPRWRLRHVPALRAIYEAVKDLRQRIRSH